MNILRRVENLSICHQCCIHVHSWNHAILLYLINPATLASYRRKSHLFLSFSIDCEVENHESTAPNIIYGSLKSSQESRKLSSSSPSLTLDTVSSITPSMPLEMSPELGVGLPAGPLSHHLSMSPQPDTCQLVCVGRLAGAGRIPPAQASSEIVFHGSLQWELRTETAGSLF